MKTTNDIRQFVERFRKENEGVTVQNAKEVFDTFRANKKAWAKCIDPKNSWGKGNPRNYGQALAIYTSSLRILKKKWNKKTIKECVSYIEEYEKEDTKQSRNDFEELSVMMFNIGFCLNSTEQVEKANNYLRKSVLYKLKRSWNWNKKYMTCYQYRSCSKQLYQSLANQNLSVSSPTKFNDIFDVPILNYFAQKNREEYALLKKVYEQNVKVACFVKSNTKGKACKEYKDPLMWAYYAKSHQGICLKYKFPIKQSIEKESILACWGDIFYTDDLSSLYKKETMDVKDAFFTKAKIWEHENEFRYICFDERSSNSNYGTIPMKENYVEAVYFGVNSDEEDKMAIFNILKERNVEFYQMRLSKEKYGELKAIKWKPTIL